MASVAIVTPLAGGELICGISLTLSLQTLYTYGFRVGIQNDRNRQVLLNMLCFAATIAGIFTYPYNATETFWQANNAALIVLFVSVQYSLVILNHNSIVRFSNIFYSSQRYKKYIDYFCFFLYLLPIATLTPIYLSYAQTVPLGIRANKGTFNAQIYKPLNIALIIATEFFATVTDIVLLYKVRSIHSKATSNLSPSKKASSHGGGHASNADAAALGVSKDMLYTYLLTWFFFLFDVVIKILIYLNYPVLFDSIISIATVCLRSRANLQYGLELQAIFNPKSKHSDAGDSAISSPINSKQIVSNPKTSFLVRSTNNGNDVEV